MYANAKAMKNILLQDDYSSYKVKEKDHIEKKKSIQTLEQQRQILEFAAQ